MITNGPMRFWPVTESLHPSRFANGDRTVRSVDLTEIITQAVLLLIRYDALLRAVGVVLGRASLELSVFERPEVLAA